MGWLFSFHTAPLLFFSLRLQNYGGLLPEISSLSFFIFPWTFSLLFSSIPGLLNFIAIPISMGS